MLMLKEKFEVLFCNNSGYLKVFIDDIWRTISQKIKYQLNNIIDRAANIKYF